MDRLNAFKDIAAQASRGEMTFPSNVEGTRRLQLALADPDIHIEMAATLLQADPLLAARAVSLANSVAFNRSGTEITSVRGALQRIGLRTLNSLVTAVAVRQIGSDIVDPVLKAKAAQLWTHTAHVAALAQVIARRVSHVDPDTAMFAGIVHEVGGFYMLSRADEFPAILDGDPADWVEYGEIPIGRGVLTKLIIPAAVMQAVEGLWEGMRALPPETLGDTLLLANDLAPVPSPLHERQGATSMTAARTIDFVSGDGTLASIMAEAADEVQSLLVVLLT